jgi:hypothetical protein
LDGQRRAEFPAPRANTAISWPVAGMRIRRSTCLPASSTE